MKVYIVMEYYDRESGEAISVHASALQANQVAAELEKIDGNAWHWYSVEEWRLL